MKRNAIGHMMAPKETAKSRLRRWDIFYRLLIPTQEAHTHLLVQQQNDPDQKYPPISECPAQRAGLIRNAMEGLQVSVPADIKS